MKKKLIKFLRIILGANTYLKFIAFKNRVEAITGAVKKRESYSQHGEDKLIYQLLKKMDLHDTFYVEIGANHPIKISNTYLLYKKGMRGIVIEPNRDLLCLFDIVRKEDIRLNIGVGPSACVQEFLMTDAHARNSFGKNMEHMQKNSIEVCSKVHVPVLTLDDVMKNFSRKVSFLSIDTEGMELEILNNASDTLERTYLLSVEADSLNEEKEILEALDGRFETIKRYGCNLILYNEKLCVKADIDSILDKF
ncbi:FkbM family methyltransferase [Desulfospira joergensenii]|uniref:FkbM family methyltransferase n=1 Tax=Desulfospira joergensenii TaxID=53329 RepID=UPI0003B4F87B|nr:FkbM family methyltransferase [Desulfospira joergensenii]